MNLTVGYMNARRKGFDEVRKRWFRKGNLWVCRGGIGLSRGLVDVEWEATADLPAAPFTVLDPCPVSVDLPPVPHDPELEHESEPEALGPIFTMASSTPMVDDTCLLFLRGGRGPDGGGGE